MKYSNIKYKFYFTTLVYNFFARAFFIFLAGKPTSMFVAAATAVSRQSGVVCYNFKHVIKPTLPTNTASVRLFKLVSVPYRTFSTTSSNILARFHWFLSCLYAACTLYTTRGRLVSVRYVLSLNVYPWITVQLPTLAQFSEHE